MEKNGAVIIPFLIPDNIRWLLQKKNEMDVINMAAHQIHEVLNEKLQSKVEYRCINCSPFRIYFSQLSNYMSSQKKFFIHDSITNEERSASIHLIAPLLSAADGEMAFRYLSRSHLLPTLPRGKNIPMYYEKNDDFITENFSTLKAKAGEAFLAFGNVPYALIPDSRSITLLEISILPYEARPTIYELNEESEELMLKRYENEVETYISYLLGVQEVLEKMKELRAIPFTPSYLSDKEKESLVLKNSFKSVILKSRLFNKIFSK